MLYFTRMILTTYILLKLAFTGTLSGMLASFIGAGAEIVIVPLLIYLNVFDDYKSAVGTSLAALLLPIGIVAVYFYATSPICTKRKESCVQWKAALILSLFFVIGSFLSYYTVQLNTVLYKRIFALSMISLGIVMFVEEM